MPSPLRLFLFLDGGGLGEEGELQHKLEESLGHVTTGSTRGAVSCVLQCDTDLENTLTNAKNLHTQQ